MKRFLLYLLAVATIVACSKSDDVGGGNNNNNETPKQPEITLGTTSSNFTTDGGQSEITFTSSVAWTAEVVNTRADAWCSIEPTSGAAGNAKITVTTTANDTPDDRSASIVIKAGTASKTINVSQKQKDALTVTASKFELGAEGGEVAIEVKANIDFEYVICESAKEWITYKSTRAMKTSTLTFSVTENNDVEKREGKITIKSGEYNEIITIYQAGGEPSIVISQNEYAVSSDGATIAVEVSSNIDVAVEIPENVDWISESTTRTTSTNTYYFDIQPNEDNDQRSTEIKFTNKENNLSEIVSITQAQKDVIVISKSTYYFGKEGGDLLFKIQTNADISVSISEDAQSWILHPSTRAMKVQSLYFEIATCDGDEIREGIITLTAGSAEQNIKVTQNPLVTTGTQIIYESSDGNIITPTDPTKFGATIVSNEYKDGIGILTFDSNVTAIGENAFQNCTTLSRIDVPEGITSIGDYAFAGCTGLEYISLANTITSIGNYAFQDCTGEILIDCDIPDAEILNGSLIGTFEKSQFTKVVISDWVTRIGNKAFYGCSSITSITIPSSVTEIGSYAFTNCSSITSDIVIPSGVTKINNYTFSGCSSISSITIPSSVTEIDSYAFSGCGSIPSLTLPSSVTEIGSYAFENCGGELTVNCNIPDVEYSYNSQYQYGKFYNSKFTKVTIGEGVTKIGNYAFYGCSSITSITIPNNVTKIGSYAFYDCSSITSDIVIPSGVTKINDYTFSGCSSISSITIPSSVTEIGSYAFYGCNSLASDIVIPSGVTKINDYTFSGCSSISSITIPSSVTEIGNYAFSGCGGKLTVNCNIPDAKYSYNSQYQYGKFYNSKFTKVTIGDGVAKIGSYAFYGCSSITSITIPSSVTMIGSDVFENCGGELTVNCNIPDTSIYHEGKFYNSNFTKVTIGDGVTKIGSYAFYDCRSITRITIPSSVTEIRSYAFSGCSSILSLTIPSSVTEIGESAFGYCCGELTVNCNIPDAEYSYYSQYQYGKFYNSKFTKVTIGEGVTKIGNYAFYGCSSITSITIPSSVTEIGSYAFGNCNNISSITIPSSVTEIGSNTFENCTGEVIINCNTQNTDSIFKNSKFSIVTFGDNVTYIGGQLFYNNEYIKAVKIGAGITSIGKDAFYDCSYLHSVYCMPTTPPALEDKYVFNYNAEDRKFYVPQASVSAYKAATNWSGYFDKIVGFQYDLGEDNGSLENPDNSDNDVEW